MFYWMERARANSSISLDLIILSRAAATCEISSANY